ncbi:MAG: transglutaminase family protein [Rhodospirillaceae bacterium]
MKYKIHHRTVYKYTQTVSISHHLLHMTPRSHGRQICSRAFVQVTPLPAVRSETLDYFQNTVTYATIQEPHNTLEIEALSEVEVEAPPPLQLAVTPPWEDVNALFQSISDQATLDAYQFAFASPYVTGIDGARELAEASFTPGRPILEAAMDLTTRIYSDFKYEGGVTDVSTPVAEVIAERRGVCQDFAHVQLACLRSLGLPARYVSGYLLTHPPAGQTKMVGADESHAWIAVWCPGLGWVDFDATNNLIPRDEHITLGWGRDYGDVSPINGFMIGGGKHTVKVSVDVQPLSVT